jgi:hypothetical protein
MTYATETGLYVLQDSDGNVISKADVPPGEHEVGEQVDPSTTFDVHEGMSLSELEEQLSDSPRNVPDHVYDRVPETARGLLASVEVDRPHAQ